MSPTHFPHINRSVRNTITIETDGPWTIQAPGLTHAGNGGTIVLTFDVVASKGSTSTLKALIIDPDPGTGNPG